MERWVIETRGPRVHEDRQAGQDAKGSYLSLLYKGSGGAPGHWCAVPYSLLRSTRRSDCHGIGTLSGLTKAHIRRRLVAICPSTHRANRTRAVVPIAYANQSCSSYLLACTQLETRRRLASGAPGRWKQPESPRIAQRTTTYRNITSQLGRKADLRFGRLLQHYTC